LKQFSDLRSGFNMRSFVLREIYWWAKWFYQRNRFWYLSENRRKRLKAKKEFKDLYPRE
jgi:hypothetical protein